MKIVTGDKQSHNEKEEYRRWSDAVGVFGEIVGIVKKLGDKYFKGNVGLG